MRTVEHYFHRYGGYSPNPIVFLAAAAQRTRRLRLITGAVLPVFNHPLQLAAEIAMLDAISEGRLEVGFARAFLPHEFRTFGRSMDESRARFEEGVEQIRRLLEEENLTMEGRFHSFANVTSLPRPTQRPRPPFWVATTASPASQEAAARAGHGIMMIPLTLDTVRAGFAHYRETWAEAGRSGRGRTMIAMHMYCAETEAAAEAGARDEIEGYFRTFAEATTLVAAAPSKDYPGHGAMVEGFRRNAGFRDRLAAGLLWVGTPSRLRRQIAEFADHVGGVDYATVQVNFHTLSVEKAEASMRLFAAEVMPHFARATGGGPP